MADDVTPLSRFQAVLSRARGSARMRFLLTQPESRALVAELPVQDLFSVIKEVGLEDASELVEMATPEQLQGCLDLDAWRADELDLAALRPWLDALVGAGSTKLTEVWRGLDPELAALIIARTARI